MRDDFLLRAIPQFFFHFDFNPESLAVKTVLKTKFMPSHGVITLVGVFVGSSPGVMNTHRIVGSHRTVNKAPFGFALIFPAKLIKRLVFFPEFEDFVFTFDKAGVSDFLKHRKILLSYFD